MTLKIVAIVSVTSSSGEVLGIWGLCGALREVERERSDGSGRGRVVVTTGDWFQDYPLTHPTQIPKSKNALVSHTKWYKTAGPP